MWRAAVLVGRSISDILAATLCVAIVAAHRPGHRLAARQPACPRCIGGLRRGPVLQLRLVVGLCLLGLISQGPESAQSLGLIFLFPLAFISNALVPTAHMPGWLQAIADWNPVSAVTAACRRLFGNPNPSAASTPGPCSTRWKPPCLVRLILAVCAPLAAYLFRRRTAE